MAGCSKCGRGIGGRSHSPTKLPGMVKVVDRRGDCLLADGDTGRCRVFADATAARRAAAVDLAPETDWVLQRVTTR